MLALDAQQAGAAMACRYASSDEYEAALIAERRAAGAYGPRRFGRIPGWLVWSVLGAAALVSVLAIY
jgi:hypothetical protein